MEGNLGTAPPSAPDHKDRGSLLAVGSSPYKAKRTASYKDKQANPAGSTNQASSASAPKVATESREGCLKCNLL